MAIDVIVQQRVGVSTAADVGFLLDDAANLFAVKPLSDFRIRQTTLDNPQFIQQAIVAQTGVPPSDSQSFPGVETAHERIAMDIQNCGRAIDQYP